MKIINKTAGRILAALIIGTAATQMVACGGVLPIVSEVRDSQGYTDSQTMLVIATERNRYRKIYTDQIWSVVVDDEGTTFQTYLLGEIQNFLRRMKTMELLAQEEEISLTSQERDQMQQLSAQYFDSLTQEDKVYMGVTEDDINTMYQSYHLSNKVVDELTSDVNLEISDSEARVMEVQEIRVADEESAYQVYAQVTAEGANFYSIAGTMSTDDQVQVSVGRGERGKEYDDAVFNLEANQISQPFAFDGHWYVVKCINPYDEAATLERKQRLALQRKNQAFSEVYDVFEAEHPVEIRGEIWENVDFTQGTDCTTTNFFEMYEEFVNQ